MFVWVRGDKGFQPCLYGLEVISGSQLCLYG